MRDDDARVQELRGENVVHISTSPMTLNTMVDGFPPYLK